MRERGYGLPKRPMSKSGFGVDSGEQPIPKRWKGGFLGVRFPGGLGGILHSGVGFCHGDEPKGLHSPTPPGLHVG